jgi:hypothetical protein
MNTDFLSGSALFNHCKTTSFVFLMRLVAVLKYTATTSCRTGNSSERKKRRQLYQLLVVFVVGVQMLGPAIAQQPRCDHSWVREFLRTVVLWVKVHNKVAQRLCRHRALGHRWWPLAWRWCLLRLRYIGEGGGRPRGRRLIVVGRRFIVHLLHHTELSLGRTSV